MDFSYLDESSKQIDPEYYRKTYKKGLEAAIINHNKRGLVHAAKWLAELFYSLKDTVLEDETIQNEGDLEPPEDACYYMCKAYFDLKEYDRCAYYADSVNTPCVKFLYYYSKYLGLEKKRIEDMTEPTSTLDSSQTTEMNELRVLLVEEKVKNGLDGYLSYLYGVICKKLNLKTEYVNAFCDAVRKEPLNWSAWQELANSLEDIRSVPKLDIPHDHWMKLFFMGQLFIEHQINTSGMQVYMTLRKRGLAEDRYIQAQLAICYHNHRVVEKAAEEFGALHAADPYRLDQMDLYSNLLYVKEEKVLLSHLAHRACDTDKYRVETCCIVGNLYSLRGEHQKSVIYFQRALKINPQYLSAWTLMGHEYMEMKNSSAAIQSYRHAIEANKRDYRAWYGLGQTYEILRMPSYGLFYYQQAHLLRPNDSRMLSAIGDTYEKLGQTNMAVRSYKLARNVGDMEGTALLKLAKLIQKRGQADLCAMLYKEYVAEFESRENADTMELCRAYRFLAGYALTAKQLTEAQMYAKKCLNFEDAKDEAKVLLVQIEQMQKISEMDEDSPMDEEPTPEKSTVLREGKRRLWNLTLSSESNSEESPR